MILSLLYKIPSAKRAPINPDCFDDYKCNDYIDSDYERFLKRNKISLVKARPKTGRDHYKFYINYITGNIVTDFLPKIPHFFI